MRDQRGIIDTIVQSSCVELFHNYGIALAPLPRTPRSFEDPRTPDLTVSIPFTGRGFNGNLSLSLTSEVLGLLKQPVSRISHTDDWARELTNQLMGRIKNRLVQFQVVLQTGLPSVVNREAMERNNAKSESKLIYLFRTMRGQIVVALEGAIDETVLRYVGAVTVASEGDIIIF